jgi:hypothetical protein
MLLIILREPVTWNESFTSVSLIFQLPEELYVGLSCCYTSKKYVYTTYKSKLMPRFQQKVQTSEFKLTLKYHNDAVFIISHSKQR